MRALALLLLLAFALPAAAEGDPFLRRTATVRAVERVGPSVVNITTEQAPQGGPFRPFAGGGGQPGFEWFFRDFFEPRFSGPSQSLGSGVLIDDQRHVLTNEHVVASADRIRVTLADGRQFDAQLVGADPNNDLAVLRIESAEGLPWIAPGVSSDLLVGEPVIAIGNPFGLSNTVTTGVLSAVDRSLRSGDRVFHGFLQTDASINPGNSGGPLLNAEGELIGINSAIYDGAQGIGFAIPIDTAMRVVRELISHGEIAPIWLGLDFQDLDATLAEALGLPETAAGAIVSRVAPEHAGGPLGGAPRRPARGPRRARRALGAGGLRGARALHAGPGGAPQPRAPRASRWSSRRGRWPFRPSACPSWRSSSSACASRPRREAASGSNRSARGAGLRQSASRAATGSSPSTAAPSWTRRRCAARCSTCSGARAPWSWSKGAAAGTM